MVDTHVAEKPAPEPTTQDKVVTAIETAQERIVYTLTGGSSLLSPRRAGLYIVAGVGIALGLPGLALIALILLALTEAMAL